MIFENKKALGIDITETAISMALLEKQANGVKLIKAASGPIPAGAIKDGKIEDAALLANAVKKLKNHNRMGASRTAVSLFTGPTVMQIMDIPRQLPSNLGNFIYDQVKHFAVLLGRKIALDFCSVSPVTSDEEIASHVLTVATDGEQINEFVTMFRQAGIEIDNIEPPLLASVRTLYEQNIVGKFDTNVLVAVLRDSGLALCVFKKQVIDLVRTRDIREDEVEPQNICEWVAEQINTVIKSYEIDSLNGFGPWEIIVAADSAYLPDNAENILKANVSKSNIQFLTNDNLCQTALLNQYCDISHLRQIKNTSPAAIGLALKLLDVNKDNLRINLNPQDIVQQRKTQRRLLVTANIIAVIVIITALALHGPARKVDKINEKLSSDKIPVLNDMNKIIEKRSELNSKIRNLSGNLGKINNAVGGRSEIYWPDLLREIARQRPKSVLITGFSGGADSKINITGVALSNEDVYSLVDILNKLELIETAQIIQTKKDNENSRFINYEIRCSVVPGKRV